MFVITRLVELVVFIYLFFINNESKFTSEKKKKKKGHVWLSSKPAHEEQRQQGIPVPLEHERRIEFPLKKMLHVESNRYSLSLSLSYI